MFNVWDLYIISALIPNIAIVFVVVGDNLDKNKLLGPNDQTDEHRELVSKLSYQIAIDLFDAVDMIDIVLEETEHDFGIPNERRFRTAFLRNIVEIILINLPFLIIRGVVFFQYGKDEFIFIAKKGIAIILSVLEIRRIRVSR